MARYGSSPAHQLNVLSQTLRQGMVDRGNLDLQKAQLEYQLNDPRNQFAREQAQTELDEMTRMKNTYATKETILGPIESQDAESVEHLGSNILPVFEQHGVVVKRGPREVPGQVPEVGFYSKTTGKRLTEWDFHVRRNLTTAIIASEIHPRAKLQQLADRGDRNAEVQLEQYDKDPAPFWDSKINFLVSRKPLVKTQEARDAIDGMVANAVRGRAEAIRKATPPKKGAGLTWEEWKKREDYKALKKKEAEAAKPPKTEKPPDLDEWNKAVSYELYDDDGSPREVDTSTKNRMDDLAESYGRTLNWEKTEDGWIVTGAMKSDTVAGAVTRSGRTAGKATNDPLGIR